MMSQNRRWRVVLLLAALLGTLCGVVAAGALPALAQTAEVASIQNEHIRVVVNSLGQFTIGTVKGDPGTALDDDKRLMYGYDAQGWTSFTSIRVVRGTAVEDVPLYRVTPDYLPTVAEGEVTTLWSQPDVQIRQTLFMAVNPFTDRNDTVKIETTASNTGVEDVKVGVRVMLDTMIGDNDQAPFFIPDTGNSNQQQEYLAADVPLYWKAFEAPDYAPDSLKGQGLLNDYGATPPDRFVVASWSDIKTTAWDYYTSPGTETGDSAVAVYWFPQQLAPGDTLTWVTYYGLAGIGGGEAWFDAPLTVTSLEPGFRATLWVSNKSDVDFLGGEATIRLPDGIDLAPGESAAKPIPRVLMDGGGQSVSWDLVADGAADADLAYSATVTFDSGSRPLTAESELAYQWIATPVPSDTPTVTPTFTPVPSATPSQTPPPTLTPGPTVTPSPTPTATPLPVSLLPFVPDTRWLWWPWLLLLALLLLVLLFLLLRRRSGTNGPRRPEIRDGNRRTPLAPKRPVRKPRSGKPTTHGRDRRKPDDRD